MPTLDLELLRTLAAVVTHRSFAAAAVHLDRTQSAVTQQMQRLEAMMQQMLERGDGGAAPAAGGTVSDWASSLFGSRTV